MPKRKLTYQGRDFYIEEEPSYLQSRNDAHQRDLDYAQGYTPIIGLAGALFAAERFVKLGWEPPPPLYINLAAAIARDPEIASSIIQAIKAATKRN